MSPTVPFLVRCWYDQADDTMRLEVLQIDTQEAVRLGDNSFLVRFITQGTVASPRSYIYLRHVGSGLETYVQGGPGLRQFVRQCLGPEPPQREPSSAVD
jgi:hypothetical protein